MKSRKFCRQVIHPLHTLFDCFSSFLVIKKQAYSNSASSAQKSDVISGNSDESLHTTSSTSETHCCCLLMWWRTWSFAAISWRLSSRKEDILLYSWDINVGSFKLRIRLFDSCGFTCVLGLNVAKNKSLQQFFMGLQAKSCSDIKLPPLEGTKIHKLNPHNRLPIPGYDWDINVGSFKLRIRLFDSCGFTCVLGLNGNTQVDSLFKYSSLNTLWSIDWFFSFWRFRMSQVFCLT
jgi:hypothetical protein